MKIVFAATPTIALPVLDGLCQTKNQEHEVVAVYTQPDRPVGRGQRIQPSPVKARAQMYGIAVEQPASLREAGVYERLCSYQPDIMIVMAYGLLLPKKILDYPRFGCVNIHLSLLPRWRGATPIQQAILHGDTETGVSLICMVPALDAGDILAKVSTPIQNDENQETLTNRLAHMSRDVLMANLPALLSLSIEPIPQEPKQVTYAPKIHKSDAQIAWTETATVIDRKIRAYYGWPVAFASYRNQILRIWQARPATENFDEPPGTFLTFQRFPLVVCGQGTGLILERVQLPGKSVITGQEFSHTIRL